MLSNCYGAHISTEAIQAALQSMLQQITAIKDPALEEIQKEAYIALLSELHPELCIWILQTKYNEDLGRRFNQEEDTILRKQFENDPFRLASLPCETRKLHGRYLDNKMWKRWFDGLPRDIDKSQRPLNPCGPIKPQTYDEFAEASDQNFTSVECAGIEAQAQVEPFLDRRELFKYLLYQFMGWIPIALACGFAATISWTTPKVSTDFILLLRFPLSRDSIFQHFNRSVSHVAL